MHQGGEGEHRRRRVRGNRTARAAAPETTGSSSTDQPAAGRQAGPAARAGSRAGSDSVGTGGSGPGIAAPRRPAGGDRRSNDGRRRLDGDETSYTAGAATSDHVPYDNHLTPVTEDHERGLRGLIGGGSSQVSVTAAMRARDAARPSDEDIAEAERSLTIVHRGWVPRDP